MLEVGHEFSEEGIAVGAEPGRYEMTRLRMDHPAPMTEKQNDSVYVRSRAWIRRRSATSSTFVCRISVSETLFKKSSNC